jgi:hypothetical protein
LIPCRPTPSHPHPLACEQQRYCRLCSKAASSQNIEETISINVKRDRGHTCSIFEIDVTGVKLLDPNQ